jgi:hypothetical protein
MKKFFVSFLVIALIVLSGCTPKAKYSQFYLQEGNFKVLLPDIENIMNSCNTENQITSCIAIASDKRVGSFFVHSEQDLSGTYSQLSGLELLNISNSFLQNQCNPGGGIINPSFLSASKPRLEELVTESGTYSAAKYILNNCSGDSDLTGYTINVENSVYLLYVMGKNALSTDNDSTLKAFFRSFQYVP